MYTKLKTTLFKRRMCVKKVAKFMNTYYLKSRAPDNDSSKTAGVYCFFYKTHDFKPDSQNEWDDNFCEMNYAKNHYILHKDYAAAQGLRSCVLANIDSLNFIEKSFPWKSFCAELTFWKYNVPRLHSQLSTTHFVSSLCYP